MGFNQYLTIMNVGDSLSIRQANTLAPNLSRKRSFNLIEFIKYLLIMPPKQSAGFRGPIDKKTLLKTISACIEFKMKMVIKDEKKPDIPAMIDELPLIILAATQSLGTTKIYGAAELKHKESNRIKSMLSLVRDIGGEIKYENETFTIKGPQKLKGGISINTADHRIAMAATVANLLCEKPVKITNKNCVKKSYPDFFSDFNKFLKNSPL
ncbi:MAG: hypothetical protein U9Q34_01800 [Elusimicrobiota bacterium]|nr:hypothetical protein [Elusimicrobiota bacterium]